LAVAAKANDVTVRGAICATLLLSLAAALPDLTRRPMTLASTVDIRAELSRSVDGAFGPFASVLPTKHRIDGSRGIWAIARDVERQEARLRTDPARLFGYERLFGLFGRLRNPRLFYSACWLTIGWPDVGLLGAHDLGQVELPSCLGELVLDGLHVAASPYFHYVLGATSVTVNGQLTLSYQYVEPFLPNDRVAAIIAESEGRLSEAALA
jgi:hypothetical protein